MGRTRCQENPVIISDVYAHTHEGGGCSSSCLGLPGEASVGGLGDLRPGEEVAWALSTCTRQAVCAAGSKGG